ncbi:hypothetical protein ACRBEV_10185 [Methylobacterium phyllosphaerae]
MPAAHKSTDVFRPNDVPTLTYVYRSEHDLESQLRLSLRTAGQIVSLSGPSKSGKTVLIKRTISADDLILVSGASITSAENLWTRVLGWMDAPVEVTKKSAQSYVGELNTKAGGSIGVPFVAKGSAEAGGKVSAGTTIDRSEKIASSPIDQVVREIGNSDFVVFIDDFHYMSPDVQKDVAKQIKEIAERGVKILTASVPHRSDDVVRSNPELRGRVRAIDFDYWSDEEIRQIAALGFAALGIQLTPKIADRITSAVFGSPQLMQAMCLQVCHQLQVEETCSPARDFDLDNPSYKRVLEHTSSTTDFSSSLAAMHAGPKLRGQDRKQFNFVDGTRGDVYRCVLLALQREPPVLSLRYDEIIERVKNVCVDDHPVGSSVSQALVQICEIAESTSGSKFIEWDEDVLDISDPYFLYYLRGSPQLTKLRSPGT